MIRRLYAALPLLVAALAVAGVLLAVWLQAPALRPVLLKVLPGAICAGLIAAAVGLWLHNRPPWLPGLRHALDLWGGANPGFRLSDPTIPGALREAFNRAADHFHGLHRSLDARIAGATLELEQDRGLLAALIRHMDGALLVCSEDGRVLLYNPELARLLADEPAFGLGRSLFAVFPRRLVAPLVEQLAAGRPAAEGELASRSERRYRARLSALDGGGHGGLLIMLSALDGAAGMPADRVAAAVPSAAPALPSRPLYFDFDLLRHEPAQALAQTPLNRLALTALDTETTGLDPTGGDEIIAIGAIRILNGRLLGQEVFESLVRTARPIHPDAQRIHGITADVLAGQPDERQVLPQFLAFCRGGVLLGHNVAFDRRFLELAAQRLGLDFAPTVLDTLLLSSVVNPQRHVHGLEDIAQRLGVAVLGRHTALGDAIVTAEVFLKLLPLLEHKGVRTLGDALAASKESWYARLEY